jgi:hypothetical protein
MDEMSAYADLKSPTSLLILFSSHSSNDLFQHVRKSGQFSFLSTSKRAGQETGECAAKIEDIANATGQQIFVSKPHERA